IYANRRAKVSIYANIFLYIHNKERLGILLWNSIGEWIQSKGLNLLV
ncbi:hypothetical protein HMPREF1553_00998, partial [Porphyromonas gingivalis F0568]